MTTPDARNDTVPHDCMEHRSRVTLAEGDDVFVERCGACGKVRFECDGVRPMAWFRMDPPAFPWKYAYDDPRNEPDGVTPWRPLDAVELAR